MDKVKALIYEVNKSNIQYKENEVTIILVLKNDLCVHSFNTVFTYHEVDVIFISPKTLFYMEGANSVVELISVPMVLFAKYQADYMRNISLIYALNENYSEKDIYYVYRDCVFIKDLLDAYRIVRDGDDYTNRILEEKLTISLSGEYSLIADSIISEEQSKRYYRTLNYINDHFKEKISLDEMSELEGLRKTSFAQSFKQISGMTFLEATTIVRLKYAQYLLATTDLTNADISKQSGFSDMKYFYRDFQKLFAKTPSEFKSEIEEYSQNYGMRELTPSEGRPYLEEQNNELAYIKVDTRLYQQYLLLKDMEFHKVNLQGYEITVDLYNESNYLIYENERYLTWYGLNLILNQKAKHHMNMCIRLALDAIHSKDEEEELLHLLERTLYRMTKREQRTISFELLVRSSADLPHAHSIGIALYQLCNMKSKTLII